MLFGVGLLTLFVVSKLHNVCIFHAMEWFELEKKSHRRI